MVLKSNFSQKKRTIVIVEGMLKDEPIKKNEISQTIYLRPLPFKDMAKKSAILTHCPRFTPSG